MQGPFANLPKENREFWLLMISADSLNATRVRECIDIWRGPDHFNDEARAALELFTWLTLTREALGLQGCGHA
jgi:hypothetical protein